MKTQDLLCAIGDLPQDMIERDALPQKGLRRIWMRLGGLNRAAAIAAAVALIAGLNLFAFGVVLRDSRIPRSEHSGEAAGSAGVSAATTTSAQTADVTPKMCPWGNYTASPVRVTASAYAPYLLELDAQTADQLYTAFTNAAWEVIPSDTVYPDGEACSVFVYNNGQPFKLVFYGDSTVQYESGDEINRYKTEDESVLKLVTAVANPDHLGEIWDTLIWCAPEFFTNEGVWVTNNYQHIEIEPECGPAFGFSFELPNGWTYHGMQTEDVPTGHIIVGIQPKDTDTSVLIIEYISGGLSVCGTDLESKAIDFNGHSATQGFFGGDDMWGFIALDGDYNGCVVKMNDPDLYRAYTDEADIILKTLQFHFYEAGDYSD